MKKIFLGILILTISLKGFSQGAKFEWAGSTSETGFIYNSAMEADEAGNIYTTGNFHPNVDFDPGSASYVLTSNATPTAFLSKMDSDGKLLWAKKIRTMDTDASASYGLMIGNDGYIYTTGYNRIMNPNSSFPMFLNQIRVTKSDASGNEVWTKELATNSEFHWNTGRSITMDKANNIYVTGLADGKNDFDPGPDSTIITGGAKLFVLKLNSNGEFNWVKSTSIFSQFNSYENYSIVSDENSNIYISGRYETQIDLDMGSGTHILTTPAATYSTFVVKMDSSGAFQWGNGNLARIKPDEASVRSLHVDKNENVFLLGDFKGVFDFDPGAGSKQLTSGKGAGSVKDVFIQKLDPSGDLVWVKSIGGEGDDIGGSFDLDSKSNIYLTGSFEETVDFDPGTASFPKTSKGNSDVFISKLDSNGVYIWAKTIGDTARDVGRAITIDTSDNIISNGSFRHSVDIDPSKGVQMATSTAVDGRFLFGSDYFMKLSPCNSSYSTNSITVCDSLTWIDGKTYSSPNTTAQFILVNSTGCDSVVTLNLQIKPVDVNVSYNGAVIKSQAIDAKFQWLDCDNNMAVISGATHSGYLPTKVGSYALEVSQYNCKDTTKCTVIKTVGIQTNSFENSFSVYPNPTSADLTINLGGLYNEITVEIRNSLGQMVSTVSKDLGENVKTSIEGPSGVYFIKVSTLEGKTVVIRIVKE